MAIRIVSDKILNNRAYEIAINTRGNEYQIGLSSKMYKFFDQKLESGRTSKREVNINALLAQELHKPVTKKFKRRKIYLRFKDNICAADLAEIESSSSKNWSVKCLKCIADVFTKYACVKPLKDKECRKVFWGFN